MQCITLCDTSVSTLFAPGPRAQRKVLSLQYAPSHPSWIGQQWRLCLWVHRRHSCAVHLLRSGVDINTIRAWLGHVSLDTTNIYAEVDMEMKAKALARCDLPDEIATTPWHTNPTLLNFLKAL